jgi:hypothetical protein
MKRAINVFTIIVIIFSLFLVSSRCNLRIAAPVTSQESVENNTVNTFGNFSLDKQKFIDIEVDEDTFNNFTKREQKDQVLDWLLYTTIYSSGITVEALSDILYDLPTIRYGYMHPVANFEFGETRSCVIGDKRIIALVPQDIAENQYKDYLVGIADKHRKDLGEEPKIIHIFRYKINLKGRYALLKRCRDVNAGVLFTDEYGYYTATVNNLDDFKSFMEKIEDITHVDVVGKGLKLGGRKLKELYRGIRVEDVAAIWQAEKQIQNRRKEFNAKWQRNLDLLNEKLEEYNRRHRTSYYSRSDSHKINRDIIVNEVISKMMEEKRSLKENRKDYQPPYMITSGPQYHKEYEKLKRMMQEDSFKERIVDSIGFSLDPTYDFNGLQMDFSVLKLVEEEEFQLAGNALLDNNIVPLLVIIDKFKKSDNSGVQLLAEILESQVESHRFQAARYDGPLQGTEVGMVLFYTDLLAKLWALDFQDSIPSKDIENFISMTATRVSPIYKQELLELPSTRLWFGTNDKGFQKVGNCNQLLFARVATRVYAASSNPLQPGKEVAPNEESAAFLGWWNDHYEEIARYEPEYQRLNEVMKWSILISWLNDVNKGHYLDFLQNVKVYKGNWFTEWVKSQQNLKFKKWEKVKFYNKGYLDTDTEAMPILYSSEYENFGLRCTLSGGVSLARKNLFIEHPPLSTRISEPMRRSGLDYAKSNIESDLKTFHTFDGQIFKLEKVTPTMASVIATPKEGTKLRGVYSEISHQKIKKIFLSKPRGLEVESKIGETLLGHLNISSDKSGFKIGWKSRDIDTGQELARKLSKVESPGDVLFKEPGLESIIQQGEDRFFIKLKSSETWLKMVPENGPIPKSFQSRVSDIEGGIKNYQLKWIKPSELGSELRYVNSEYIKVQPFKNTGKEMIVVNPTRGPPTASKPFEIDYGHFKIKGRIDQARGEIFVERGSIPGNLLETPDKLHQVVKNDIPKVIEAAKGPGKMIRYKGTNLPDCDAVFTSLRNKDYGKAAKEIVQNPQQFFKSSFNDYLKDELLRNEKYLEAGHYSKAGYHLEDLMVIYGPQPELKIRKGIILLKRGRCFEAKNHFFNVLTDSKGPDIERFLKNINSHLENSAMKFAFNKDKNKSYLEYFLDKTVEGKIVKETESGNIIKNKSTIYIQDDPSLTNLDWYTATKTGNLAQAIRGRKVVKLLESNIDKMKPEILHVPGEITKNLSKIKPSTPPPPPPSPYCFIPYPSYDDDDDDYEREKSGEIYLIFAGSQ